MKTQTTRTSPNYGLILTIIISVLFWFGIINVLFGQQIKAWVFSMLSLIL